MSATGFNAVNAHPRDKEIEFEPVSHTYRHKGKEFISVTTLVEGLFPKFEKELWAERVAARRGLSAEEVLAMWEEEGERARTLGTDMHDKIERFYLGEDISDDGDAFGLFRLFAEQVKLKPYRTEWRIFDEDYGLAGTLDFLEQTAEGEYNIWDWKRSCKLVDKRGNVITSNPFGKRGFYPVNHLSDSSFFHYALQLSTYRFILEHKYGIRIKQMKLGVFHPNNDRAWAFEVPYLDREVRCILERIKNNQAEH